MSVNILRSDGGDALPDRGIHAVNTGPFADETTGGSRGDARCLKVPDESLSVRELMRRRVLEEVAESNADTSGLSPVGSAARYRSRPVEVSVAGQARPYRSDQGAEGCRQGHREDALGPNPMSRPAVPSPAGADGCGAAAPSRLSSIAGCGDSAYSVERGRSGVRWCGRGMARPVGPAGGHRRTGAGRLRQPLGEANATVMAWRDWRGRHRIVQPFKRAHCEVCVLTAAEVPSFRRAFRSTTSVPCFSGGAVVDPAFLPFEAGGLLVVVPSMAIMPAYGTAITDDALTPQLTK